MFVCVGFVHPPCYVTYVVAEFMFIYLCKILVKKYICEKKTTIVHESLPTFRILALTYSLRS